jgi:hypothetical protein
MHGFLNIFAAGVLVASSAVGEDDVREILACEDGASFRFVQDAMYWNDIRIDCDAIAEGRRHVVTSFGSCSFDEPREALRKLGLLRRGKAN